MMPYFVNPKHERTWWRPAGLAILSLAAMTAAGDHAGAASGHNERSVTSVESRAPGEPIMAVISLRDQRITVYDAQGWILRAPVSSGQKRRHTLAGISPSKLLSITPEPAAKPKPCFRVRHGEI